jgi:hypothetical protein
VESREAGGLALSGLALSKETRPAAELGLGIAGLADSLTPLVTDDMQIVPSGSNQFAKAEKGFVYFEIYAAEPDSVRVGMRVLERKTGEAKSDSGLLKTGAPRDRDAIPLVSRLPIDALGTGSYTLEITAVDLTGRQVRRTADFDVR